MKFILLLRTGAVVLLLSVCIHSSRAQTVPPADAFQVLQTPATGPRITPFLKYQLDEAWRLDEKRQEEWAKIQTEQDLLALQQRLRESVLQMIGGLPTQKTDLHPRIVGKIQEDGYSIEKLIYESLPGIYVTALVYSPEDHATKHPAVLVPAGHATNGKIHYQALSQRLVRRGYVVIAWDPIGQGERSQFWDANAKKSRYNLICGEHAILGNLAYLAGANLARWEIWDGIRAVDYLLTRPDVDGDRISITGTSGGGTQTALIAALDPRIKVAVPSCYITSLPMRMANRMFADPDSDPEQDLFGMVSNDVDHPGLLLLMYPRPVMVAAAVLDFFPIEGARKSFREAQRLYERFGHANRIGMTEGYNAHQYSDENQEAALDFLDRFNEMPLRHGLPVPKQFSDIELLCTRSGQVMIDQQDARSLMDVIREYYEQNKKSTNLSLRDEYWKARRGSAASWTVAPFAGAPPTERQISWEAAGHAETADAAIEKYILHHSGSMEMPVLYLRRKSAEGKKTLMWFSEAGKAAPRDWPELEKYLRSGYNVISFDFRGLGETRMRYTAVSVDDPALGKLDFDHAYSNPLSSVFADHVYNAVLLGRPYFYQMIEDAEIAAHFARTKLSATPVSVTGHGFTSTLASAVAEVFPEISLVPQSDATPLKWSEIVERKEEIWPIEFLVPGGGYTH